MKSLVHDVSKKQFTPPPPLPATHIQTPNFFHLSIHLSPLTTYTQRDVFALKICFCFRGPLNYLLFFFSNWSLFDFEKVNYLNRSNSMNSLNSSCCHSVASNRAALLSDGLLCFIVLFVFVNVADYLPCLPIALIWAFCKKKRQKKKKDTWCRSQSSVVQINLIAMANRTSIL